MTDQAESFKVCILGPGAVGKSSLTVQYIKGHFKTSYDPTIEDAYVKQTEVDGRIVTLNILDTAGQEEYTSLRDQYLRDSEGFIMVFSLTDASSFHEIREIFEQLARSKEEEGGLNVVLVGNKCDLVQERVVQREQVDTLLEELSCGDEIDFQGTVRYVESSAKDRINVDEAFEELVRLLRNEMKGAAAAAHKLVGEKKKSKSKRMRRARTGLFGSLCRGRDLESDLDVLNE